MSGSPDRPLESRLPGWKDHLPGKTTFCIAKRPVYMYILSESWLISSSRSQTDRAYFPGGIGIFKVVFQGRFYCTQTLPLNISDSLSAVSALVCHPQRPGTSGISGSRLEIELGHTQCSSLYRTKVTVSVVDWYLVYCTQSMHYSCYLQINSFSSVIYVEMNLNSPKIYIPINKSILEDHRLMYKVCKVETESLQFGYI